MYVDIFDAMYVYLFRQWFDSKMPCQLNTFFPTTVFDAATHRYISVIPLFSAFQDDGFLGIFFPIQLPIQQFWIALC